jgi:hypothetical protein
LFAPAFAAALVVPFVELWLFDEALSRFANEVVDPTVTEYVAPGVTLKSFI